MDYFIQTNYLPYGYLINKLGQVKSPKGKILKQSFSNSGYKFINIKNKGYFIHRAICFAFVPLVVGKNLFNFAIAIHVSANAKITPMKAIIDISAEVK